MANTGKERATTLLVTKSVGGVQQYSKTYSLLDAFSTYEAITNTQAAALSVDDYTARLNAFKSYVQSIEIGLTIDITQAYRDNLTSCPI